MFLKLNYFVQQSTLIIDPNSYVYGGQSWERKRGLEKKKYRHRSIVINGNVYHVGGTSNWGGTPKLIEKWTHKESGFIKEYKEMVGEDDLDSYGDLDYPELLIAPDDLCQVIYILK